MEEKNLEEAAEKLSKDISKKRSDALYWIAFAVLGTAVAVGAAIYHKEIKDFMYGAIAHVERTQQSMNQK